MGSTTCLRTRATCTRWYTITSGTSPRSSSAVTSAYESVFNDAARSELPMMARNEDVEALILFGASDHVLYPDFDRMAAVVFPNHIGPFLLRDCGHFVPWEAPGPLASAIRVLCRDLR